MNTEPLTKQEAIALQFALKMCEQFYGSGENYKFVIDGADQVPKMAVEQADSLLRELDSTKPVTDAEFDEALNELRGWSNGLTIPPNLFSKAIALLELCKCDIGRRNFPAHHSSQDGGKTST